MSFAYMPLFTGDYLRDTQHLSMSEHGAYLKLLMHCWDQKGPVPLDERKLMGICNARSTDEIEAMRRVIGEFFVRMDDGHYNRRMQSEIERSEALSRVRSNAGRMGYEAKAKQLPSKSLASARHKPLSPSPSPSSSLSSTSTQASSSTPKSKPLEIAESSGAQELAKATWETYRSAFASRWGTDPVRNARVNSQVKQVVAALGVDAPNVAAYFVSHNDRFYVSKRHPVGCLLKDAEGLHVQWATGVKSTSLEAKSAESIDSVYEQVRRVSAQLEGKKA